MLLLLYKGLFLKTKKKQYYEICGVVVFRQEIDRIQRVIRTVQSTLCNLKLAIDGTIVMSQGLRESLDAMYDARIPSQWLKVHIYPHVLDKHYSHIMSRRFRE